MKFQAAEIRDLGGLNCLLPGVGGVEELKFKAAETWGSQLFASGGLGGFDGAQVGA